MDKETENEITSILDEQVALENVEVFAGNEVKRNFHKGAVFGIKLILDILFATQPTDEAPAKLQCDICRRTETPPYDEGDECYCGGIFRTRLMWAALGFILGVFWSAVVFWVFF